MFGIHTIYFSDATPDYRNNKEDQFKGLCAVVEYLCELDNIPNVMDYTALFDFNEDLSPKKELTI